ncbi:MAG: 30S ribosomal protein S6 [Candidatus Kaiserbacteria bacterium]|nr:30S ribosomal protein S6 [Candidatus Kaiserbacteria bacterium]
MAKNQEEEVRPQDTLASEGSESRVYELGFHLDSALPIEEVKKAYQAMRGVITEKGMVVAESEPEKVQLAYTISRQEVAGRRDFDSAYFAWIVYETSAEDHAEVLKVAHADKRIFRFIDLLTTKDAARHSLEVRDLAKKAPERAEDTEAVLGAELDAALEGAVI